MEGTVKTDSGAQIRDGMKSINRLGVCSETEWPYNINIFNEKPTEKCYDNALDHHTIEYRRLNQDVDQLKACITSGFPFVFGFAVFESFETEEVAKTGNMVMPEEGEKQLGGHAIMAVGYDDDKKVFVIQNSWGEEWGDKGYFYMPYDFITNEEWCSDFWTCYKITDEDVELVNVGTQCNIKKINNSFGIQTTLPTTSTGMSTETTTTATSSSQTDSSINNNSSKDFTI